MSSNIHFTVFFTLFFIIFSISNSFIISSYSNFFSAKISQYMVVQSTVIEREKNTLRLKPITFLNGEIHLPGSKSLSNRCLLIAAISSGRTRIENLLCSDDTQYMLEALETLDVPIERRIQESSSVIVTGTDGPIDDTEFCSYLPRQLFLGNAGTAIRPLTAVLSMGKGEFILDGVPRMRQRPILDLIDGLSQLGANIKCSSNGCPPVVISADGNLGGKVSISGKTSSQFLSSLLIASPLADKDILISISDKLISAPYVLLTISLMKKFGVNVQIKGDIDNTPSFLIPANEKYVSPGFLLVEGDASSASYFIAGAAITGGKVTVRGCGSGSVQGDIKFAYILQQMGATVIWDTESITVTRCLNVRLKGIDVDCSQIPDAAMTLAVVALFAKGPTIIRNVYSWRLKETERMKAIVAECTKLGAIVEEYEDYCVINPPGGNKINDNVLIETYDDHRMAMAFSLVACGGVNVIINNPSCTAKTFPDFFEKLESISMH